MLKKFYTKTTRFTSAVMAYFLIAIAVTIIWYFLTKEFLLNLESIPEQQRRGYDNPFLSLLAVTFGFLLVAFIVYEIIITLLSKLSFSIVLKVLAGIFAGILPVVCLQLMTFGISLSDLGMLTEFLAMGIGGGLIPVGKKLMLSFFKAKIL